jgi:hypothetical protein
MKKDIFAGIQTFCSEIGEAACLAFCILKIIERIQPPLVKINILASLEECIELGYISYDWDNPTNPDNFYVKNPAGIMEFFIGGKWEYRHEAADYKPELGEYVIYRWERKTPNAVLNHFNLGDWDSIINSKTVALGQIASTRILKRMA